MISTTSNFNDAIAFNIPHVKIIRSHVIHARSYLMLKDKTSALRGACLLMGRVHRC